MILFVIYNTILFVLLLSIVKLYIENRDLKNNPTQNIYLQAIIKHVPLCIYFKDLRGNITLANNEFAKAAGISCSEIQNKKITQIYAPSCIKETNIEDLGILQTGKPFYSEKIMTFANNKSAYYRIVKSPIVKPSGKITGFIIVLNNIDKEKKIEANKENFIATLTHDLKTPTYAQMNTLNMLLNGAFGKLNDEQTEMIQLSKCSCKYVSDLIATILDTYRYNEGNVKLNPETFDIYYLATKLKTGLGGMAKERNQTIEFSAPKNICEIYADRLQIKRVIFNLLSNAITYGYKNSTILINIKDEKNEIEFTITNQSEQIPEKELSTMFKRFKETKLSYFNKTSTGLGLYLSKKIIDMHNGKIFAKSYPDGKCIFGFKLPKTTIPPENTDASQIHSQVV